MTGICDVLVVAATAALAGCDRGPASAGGRPAGQFPVATEHLEQNATDGDVEVVFDVVAGALGLTTLAIRAPDGRCVVMLTVPDTSTLGLRQYHCESPEPRGPRRVLAAYPEGVYTFTGTTVAGDSLMGHSTLTHRLPASAAVVHLPDEAQGVPTNGHVIHWKPVTGISDCLLLIEGPDAGEGLRVSLPDSATTFTVPAGILRPDREYQLAVGTVLAGGNTAFVEATVITGKESLWRAPS